MKHLLIVVMMLAPFIAQSQSYQTNRPEIINPIFDSIVQRGLQEGIQVDLILIDRLVEIEVVERTPRRAGGEVVIVEGKKAKIYVAERCIDDPNSLERILAHEIAHVVGIPHCCSNKLCASTMSTYTSINPRDLLYQLQSAPEHWEELFAHPNWHILQSRVAL